MGGDLCIFSGCLLFTLVYTVHVCTIESQVSAHSRVSAHVVNVAASVQMYVIYILGKHPCRLKSCDNYVYPGHYGKYTIICVA